MGSIHSTGGPGSLSTILCPVLLAAAGIPVSVLSVKGALAGAVDALATLAGYRTSLTRGEAETVLGSVGLVHVGEASGLAPADAVLWRARARTGHKRTRALIAASLLGKSLAGGAQHGAIDVRVGPAGNAGDDIASAFETAAFIRSVANDLGMRVTCILSDCRTLQWGRLGRLDALISTMDALLDPALFIEHPHVRQCIRVAALAAEAVSPLRDETAWVTEIQEAFLGGLAWSTFQKSCHAHGASAASFEEARVRARSRESTTFAVAGRLDGVSAKALMAELRDTSPGAEDTLGISVDDASITIHHLGVRGIDPLVVRHAHRSINSWPPMAMRVLRHSGGCEEVV